MTNLCQTRLIQMGLLRAETGWASRLNSRTPVLPVEGLDH